MRKVRNTIGSFAVCLLTPVFAMAEDSPKRLAEQLQDNSFFIEEAYNQEPGVVQHILTAEWSVDKVHGQDDESWTLAFTQEWPIFSQRHQFALSIPYGFISTKGDSHDGIADIEIAYRFQALMETDRLPAFAPAFSLTLPTGDDKKGLGDDTVGIGFTLPVSKVLADRWTAHANAGVTILPDVEDHDLVRFALGGSVVYAVTAEWNLLVELLGNWDEEVSGAGRITRPFSAILSPGTRYAFNFSNDAQLVFGVAAPIGLNSEAPDYGVFLYASFEHFFRRQ